MGVDFSGIVLGANFGVFGNAVEIDPIVSQPGKVPYAANGIYTSRQMLVQLDSGAVVQSQQTTLGIREIDFAVIPDRGDLCTLVDPLFGRARNKVMWVSNIYRDGQGGATLELREEVPVPP